MTTARGPFEHRAASSPALLRSARQRAQRLRSELAGQRAQLAAMRLAPEALREGQAALEQAITASQRLLDAIEAELHQR